MGHDFSKLQKWMLDRAAANNSAEPDASRDENSCRQYGCDLYFCEVLNGYFNLRPRRRSKTSHPAKVRGLLSVAARSLLEDLATCLRRGFSRAPCSPGASVLRTGFPL